MNGRGPTTSPTGMILQVAANFGYTFKGVTFFPNQPFLYAKFRRFTLQGTTSHIPSKREKGTSFLNKVLREGRCEFRGGYTLFSNHDAVGNDLFLSGNILPLGKTPVFGWRYGSVGETHHSTMRPHGALLILLRYLLLHVFRRRGVSLLGPEILRQGPRDADFFRQIFVVKNGDFQQISPCWNRRN